MYKVLVIDDDFEILKLMKNILELQNFSVTTYQKIELPIRLADFTGYDLILLDVMMPDIDGMELCQTIRNHITTPIIFVSAKDTEKEKNVPSKPKKLFKNLNVNFHQLQYIFKKREFVLIKIKSC